MIEVGKSIYCNWNWNWSQTKTKKIVSAMLLGYCGVGKSRLMNNLCDANQKVGVGRKTITQQICQKQVKLLENCSFSLYNTPGIHKNDIKGSNTFKRSLRLLYWNVIIVQAKLQSRFQDCTLTQLSKIAKFFSSQQSKKVIYLVSHADILDEQKDKNKILKKFKNCLDSDFNNKKVILFSNQNSNFEILAKILYSCAVQFYPTSFDVEDKKFCRSLAYQMNQDHLQDKIRQCYLNLMNIEQTKRGEYLRGLQESQPQVHQILRHHLNQKQLDLQKKSEINSNSVQTKQVKKQGQKAQSMFTKPSIYTNQTYISGYGFSKEKQHHKIQSNVNPPLCISPNKRITQNQPIILSKDSNSYLYNQMRPIKQYKRGMMGMMVTQKRLY